MNYLKTIFLLTTLLVIFLVMSYYFLLRIPLTTYHQYKVLLHNTLQKNQSLQNDYKNQKSFFSNYPRKLLTQPINVNELMVAITQIASQCQFNLLSINPTLRYSSKNIIIAQLRITGTGNFFQVIHFYQKLLASPYFMKLSNWQLIKTGSSRINLKLLLEVYHYQH